MAKGLNKVMLIGYLGGDPDVKTTPNGMTVANFSVATNEDGKDKDGNKVEKTEWHRIVVWNKLAEVAGQYLKKGSHIYLEGKLQTRSWEKDGQKHYITEIVAYNFQFLDRKDSGASGPPAPSDGDAPANSPQPDKEDLPF